MKNSTKILFNTFMKQRTFILFLVVLCTSSIQMLFGQSLANYKAPNGNLVRSTGITYNSIEFTGNAVPSWRYTGAGAEDDDRSFPVNIGFDFWYLGTRYTTFSVSTNGFIDFSSATNNGGPATNQYGSTDNDLSQPATATTRTMPLTIAPFYYDQTTDTTGGGLDALGNGIKYLTSGTVGNRVLTVEWIRSQPWYSGTGGSPQFNYQVKLYEGTGVIAFVYGYMDISTFSFAAQTVNIVQGYTSGMNGTSISNPPTAVNMLVQQTQNSATFSNTGVTGNPSDGPHTLQTLPATNTSITFTPPVPTAPTGISFTGVTQTAMQVNWNDSPNEIGYVIYRSDDGGASYNFVTQLAANTIFYNQTGLLAGATYYWKIYSVSEGALSTALTGSRATTAPGNDTTLTSGLWSSAGTWKSGSVPTTSSNVVIDDGHTVTIDQNVTVNSLTIGKGTSGILQIGNDATARTISVTGTIDVRSGGTLRVNTASNTSSHVLNTTGNIQNSGTFDMSSDADSRASVNFIKSGTQSISGSGATTRFYFITMNLGGSASNFLDVFATNFSSSTTNYLTITSGIFNLATGVTTTPFTGNVTIPLIGGLRVNHTSAVLNTTGGSLTVVGEVRVMNGTLNIGSVSDNSLVSNGGTFVFSGGAINVAGRFDQVNGYALTTLTMSGGILTVNTVGSTSTTSAPFNMNVPGSVFTMNSGSIIVQRAGNPGGQNLGFVNTSYTNYSVTGGTIQIGNASTPAASTIRVNSSIPVYNFVVNSSNVAAQLFTNNLTVLNDVTIALGTLNANTLNIAVAGNWSNNGTFTPSTGKVTFNGIGSQSITDPTGETYNKLFVNASGTLSLINNVTVADSFALTSGTFDVSTLTLTLNGVVVGGGTLTSAMTGIVNYNKSTAVQTVLAANYGNLTLSAFSKTFPSAIVGVAGTLTAPNPATAHVMTGNTIDFNGSSPQTVTLTTANFRYNNLILSNSTPKTAGGAVTATGNLTIGNGIAFVGGTNTITVNGNVSNSGSITGSGAGALVLTGGAIVHTLSGSGSYQSVTLNDVNGAVLSSNVTINGTLTFTNGVITTNTDTLTAAGTIARTAGHVNGWLKKQIATGATTVTYEIGDATNYTPATFVFGNVTNTGSLSVRTVNTEHPNINSSFIDVTNNVNRYWETRFTNLAYNIGTGYNLTLTYVASDCDVAGNAGFRMNWFNGAFWDSTNAGTRTTTTNQATSIDSLGTYAIGLQVTSGAYRTKATGNWSNFGTVWERFNGTTWVAAAASPTSTDGLITVRNGHTVTVAANVTIDQTIVETGGTLIVNGGNLTLAATTNALVINGTFRWTANTFSGATAATMKVNTGGIYQHAITNAAQTAIPTATWNASSTCEITGATNAANNAFRTSLGQTFGNFKWNSAGQTAQSVFNGNLVSVAGDFIASNTGSSSIVLYANQTTTTNISGSFIVNGGTVFGKTGNGTATINVGRNDSIASGTLSLSTNGAVHFKTTGGLYVRGGTLVISASAAADSITLKGDLVLSGGTVTESSTGSGIIALQGTSDQIFTSGATISNTINFVVFNGAILKTGTSILTGNDFILSSGATLKIGSAAGITSAGATGNIQTTTRTFNSSANYIYEGSAAQVTGIFTTTPTVRSVFDLEINNINGVTLSDSVAVNDTLKLTNGNFGVNTYTLYINNAAVLSAGTLSSAVNGTVNYNRSSAGQTVLAFNYGNLIFSNFNKLLPSIGSIGIAGIFSKGFATGHTIAGSTVNFNGITQSIPKFTFNNLTVSGSGTKTADSTIIVNETLTLSAGTLALSTSSVLVSAKGNIVNNAATSGSGKISLNGGATSHVLSGTGSYNNFEINDALGATSSSDITVNGTLTLTNGVFGMGTNTLVIGSSGTTVQTLGYVNGKMRKTIPLNALPQTITFEVGDASVYAPVTLTFNAVSVGGTLTVSTTGADHPLILSSGINQNKDVNRYWTLTNSDIIFSSYDITLNFVAGDLDAGANTNAFFAKRYNSTWFAATASLRNSTWIKSLNIPDFGEFATGEVATILYWTKGAGTYNWGDDNNWSTNSQPTAFNDVVFNGKDTIEVNVPGTTKNLVLQNDTLRLTILAANTLTVNGNLTQYSGQFSTLAAFPAVSGTVALTGGTFGYDAPGSQNVTVQTYNNLRVSSGGTKTAAGVFTVNNIMTIGSGTTFADAGNSISVKDSVVNNGIHSGAGKILLNGSSQQYIGGVGSFSAVELNNASGTNLRGSLTISSLAMTSGTMNTGPDSVTITGTRTGSGIIIGKIRRLHAFIPSVSYEFESPNNTINFVNGTMPTSVTVKVALDSTAITNTYMNPINRYYDITQAGGSGFQYKLRLHYEDAELGTANSETTPPLRIWNNDSLSVWTRIGVNSNDAVNNWVQWDSVTTAGRYSLSSRTITNVAMLLAANAVNPAPGDQVTYTISYSNSGDGSATNFLVVAPIPSNTAYLPNSVVLNGTPTTDAVLGIPVNPSTISFNLGILPSSSSGTIVYKVVIN
ncbi:MAG TPA: hypothetical protein DCQ28_14525 [Bacteroidetes bacterium]|nr:hypothetical protein [Bacteroidota bacterium]